MEIPTEFIVGAAVAIAGAVGALWAKIATVEKSRDEWVKSAFDAKTAEKKNSEAMRELLAEVERREGRRPSIPPPSERCDDEEEKTEVRRQTDAERRVVIAAKVRSPYRDRQSSIHDPELLRFLRDADSTPPETPDALTRTWPPRRGK